MSDKQIDLLSELVLNLQNDLHTLKTKIEELAEQELVVNEKTWIDCIESTKKEIENAEKAIECAINHVEQLKEDIGHYEPSK